MTRPTRSDAAVTRRRTRADRRGSLLPGASPAAAIRQRVLAIASQVDDPATRLALDELVSGIHQIIDGIERRIGEIDRTAGLVTSNRVYQRVTFSAEISTGAITLPSVGQSPRIFEVTVDTESAASLDDLDSINGGSSGDRTVLRSTASARDVRLTKTGNMKLPIEFPTFSLTTTDDRVELEFNGSNWHVIHAVHNS